MGDVTGWQSEAGFWAFTFARFFACAAFHFSSAFRNASLGTLSIFVTALSKRSHSVSPGALGLWLVSCRRPFSLHDLDYLPIVAFLKRPKGLVGDVIFLAKLTAPICILDPKSCSVRRLVFQGV